MSKAPHTISRICILLCVAIFISLHLPAQVITTVAGIGTVGYFGDHGPATAATLDSPGCVATDAWGNIYISDQLNNCVRKVNTSGIITTIAGTGAPGYNGDGIAATAAQLNSNWGIAVDISGNLYIADQNNNRVRKVDTAGIITTIAGTGTAGFYGDNGPARSAEISHPIGVAVDRHGNLFVGDADNFRVRRIDVTGIITTIAGTGTSGYSGDGGPATAASMGFTWGLATDGAGYVYICDAGNNCIRRADPAPGGQITTVAGNSFPGDAGDGGAATAAMLDLPTGVFVNNSGEILIADCKNNKIRKVSLGGVISTIAGTGTAGFAGDNGLATLAQLYRPLSVCSDRNNNLYLADLDNVRIREISVVSLLFFAGGHNQSVNLCQNTNRFSIDSIMAIVDYTPGNTDEWSILASPMYGSLEIGFDTTSDGGMIVPAGFSYTPLPGYTGNDVFTVLVTNGALSDTTVVNVTVIPPVTTAGVITGASALCIGFAVTLTDSVGGGIWCHSDNYLYLALNGDKAVVTGLSEGIDTMFYIVSNLCNADTARRTIAVLPVPDAGAINGLNSVCVSAMITLTDVAPGGAWSSVDNAATVSGGVVTGRHPGPALIEYTVPNAACVATANYIVHVDSLPLVPVIVGQESICTGAEVALDGGSGLGTWSSGNEEIAAVNAQTGLVIGSSGGTAEITYVITNSCGAAGGTVIMTVNALPEIPLIARRGNILFAPTGFAAYQWSVNGKAITGEITDTFHAIESGIYGVAVATAVGCSRGSQPYTYMGCVGDDLEIYPNPVQTTAYIVWCDKATVRVTTADGRVVLTAKDTNTIDLSSVPDGVYLFTAYDTNGRKLKTKRITKVAQ